MNFYVAHDRQSTSRWDQSSSRNPLAGQVWPPSLTLHLHNVKIGTTTSVVLDIVQEYRRAKLSQAIRNGQARAVAAGKRIGRPIVPGRVRDRIRGALASDGGIRATARLFNVSPASVINIRRTMAV
jgi:hypothetical protein